MMEIIDDLVDMGVKAVTFSGGGDPFYYLFLLDTVKGCPRRLLNLHHLQMEQDYREKLHQSLHSMACG